MRCHFTQLPYGPIAAAGGVAGLDLAAVVLVVELAVVVVEVVVEVVVGDPALVEEVVVVVVVAPGVVFNEAGGVVIAPGESIGTINFPGGISAGLGFGKSTTG